MIPDLFSMLEAARFERDAGIAQVDQTVTDDPFQSAVVEQITEMLIHRLKDTGRLEFTADLVGVLLDEMQIVDDLSTRRRLASTIINRGKGKHWRRIGSAQSARRHCAEMALWQLTEGDGTVSGDLIAMARSGITLFPGEAKKVATAYDKLQQRCIRAERILAALREPSENVNDAMRLHIYSYRLTTMRDVNDGLRAAVAAAEKEVGA
jgi:hypothetical protein